ncbi:MAG: hypothetical protein WDO18_05485 [Acidobacteriota bacterium]
MDIGPGRIAPERPMVTGLDPSKTVLMEDGVDVKTTEYGLLAEH